MANPTASILVFLFLTLGYSTLKYFTKDETSMNIWTWMYIALLMIAQFVINMNLTKEICGFNQFGVALWTTLVPWTLIFGILFLLILVFPSWLSPFSNTIGYAMCYITGISSFFKGILHDRIPKQDDKNNSEFIQALNNLYEDKSLLINQISLDELPKWWESLSNAGLLKKSAGDIDGDAYNELKSYIKMKDTIAEFIWYLLTGLLVTSTSYNYILNVGCDQSVAEMQKRHDEYLEKEEEIAKAKQEKQGSQIIYKSYE